MANVRQRIEAELENIQAALDKLPDAETLSDLSELELAGVAALIHSFYNGIESILKQFVRAKGKEIPKGETWHRDLLGLAVSLGSLSEQTAEQLKSYLAFRHFFSHAYAFDVDPARIVPLVENAEKLFDALQMEVEKGVH